MTRKSLPRHNLDARRRSKPSSIPSRHQGYLSIRQRKIRRELGGLFLLFCGATDHVPPQPITDLDLMQMIGRAGRPQFDDSGVAGLSISGGIRSAG